MAGGRARSKEVEAGGWRLEAFGWRLGLEARGSIKRGFGEQECSTSFPGGNLVDGLPPVSSVGNLLAINLLDTC